MKKTEKEIEQSLQTSLNETVIPNIMHKFIEHTHFLTRKYEQVYLFHSPQVFNKYSRLCLRRMHDDANALENLNWLDHTVGLKESNVQVIYIYYLWDYTNQCKEFGTLKTLYFDIGTFFFEDFKELLIRE